MQTDKSHIEVRAVSVADAAALHRLDYSFETDRIYTLKVYEHEHLSRNAATACTQQEAVLTFSLVETPVDPPLYKDLSAFESTQEGVEVRLRAAAGGYVALADGEIAGVVLLNVETWRAVARVEDIIVGRQFRRYGIGSLLLSCACDWARNQGCWAILLETQNTNYPAIQFYLRNGLQIWSINRHFYPPGPYEHEVALFMGKRLLT
jgi:GNAT superfamily N-acetyltransferase